MDTIIATELVDVDERPRYVVVENGPAGTMVHGTFSSDDAAWTWLWHACPPEPGLTVCEVLELTPALACLSKSVSKKTA